ncbi:hypothetical protein CNR22_21740 [Sphingobacteriaceae bacterium]|nr:hypothetical protein CNR22_21740 [Sphingobacteriaceae bacterium]
MKKITLLLFALAAFSKPAFSQAVISIDAPQYDGYWSALLGPNGYASSVTSPTLTMAYNRACYLITQAELTRMIATNSVVTDFGFDFYRPGSTAVTGQFTLYLQNTSDVTYNKGTTFSSIITGMSTNYNGALILPGAATQATAAVSVPLSSNFTYTGGGIYVAWDWYTSAPTSTAYARYLATYDGSTMGVNAMAPSAGPAPTTLTVDIARPSMRFKAANTATNEVGVNIMQTPGLDSRQTGGQEVLALVKNNSLNALTNIPVTLSVTGANSYINTQTVATLAPGATTVVVFPAHQSTVSGANNMTVTVPSDQYVYNNGLIWTQTVTCADYGNNPPVAASSFSSESYGAQATIATPFMSSGSSSITGIKYAPSQTPGGSYQMRGVLLDAGGTILATTNTLNLSAASYGTYANFKFTPPVELTPNTQYFYGISQLTSGVFAFGTLDVLATTNLNLYYFCPNSGGSIGSPQNQMGYLGLQATLSFSQTTLDEAYASSTVICKQDGANSVTLTAFGGSSSFSWTPGNLGGAEVVVTPTVAGASGTVNYVASGTDGVSKCKSNTITVPVVVSACAAISSNTSNGFDLKLYPNPSATGKSTLSGLSGTNVITVYNTLGQIVATQKSSEETTEIDLSSQPSGNYMVKISSDRNETRLVKLIK